MWFFRIILFLAVVLMLFYYITVFVHLFFSKSISLFNGINENHLLIPFYGWIKVLKKGK